jgi:hypothetical protein
VARDSRLKKVERVRQDNAGGSAILGYSTKELSNAELQADISPIGDGAVNLE